MNMSKKITEINTQMAFLEGSFSVTTFGATIMK